MQNEILEIDYSPDFKDYRLVWFDYYKKSLPNTFAFWGTGAVLSSVLWYFFDAQMFFGFFAAFCVVVPFTIAVLNYQHYMQAAKKAFTDLATHQQEVKITFQKSSDGFDCQSGKDSSHISWETVEGVKETDKRFVFELKNGLFVIPKSAFQTDEEVRFLRFLISVNVNKNVKLLS